MPEDENGLRVGGWVPPYSDPRTGGSPAARPALPRGSQRPALGPGQGPPPHSIRHLFILAAAAALGCAATALVALNTGGETPAPVAQQSAASQQGWPAFPLEPEETIPLLPKPSPSRSHSRAVTPVATRVSSASPPAKPGATPASPTAGPAGPTAPQPVSLTAGATAGLELVDQPGQWVRHRNFAGRVDPISAAGSDGDRADSRFVIRTGRAASNCFSFESVNFPGYYLRHRDFRIELTRAEQSELFDEDSTFCAESIRNGAALTLRSHNYPSRHIAVNGERLVIAESGAAAFRPQPPL
ncbi:putative alpha-L-arabinofuranosidase [Actinoplanes missouriensis 431]|uniref:Putative alpha-L-arabinofuranosidase n=1 Tax=Actinoplanes missouriensis (strain ATCC 14538 / DSM 43046 / CBS 188.64 / JCM 3121 / NBRC 102363 / NCIMB 12654 / NRRL B-3342 / UNCC 431) TaxID=512565 RepID=I0HD96_ACTM4|nr:AbfB domain-containing protein [Actinoplanes missouriensis]BAL90983.1 putative alpha-L-arabinofuranosidase [Actinoplanes missouriensis 431]